MANRYRRFIMTFIHVLILYNMVPVFAFASPADPSDAGKMIYQAFIREEMDMWRGAIEILEKEYRRTGDNNFLYELTLARYGYIGYNIGIENETVAREQIALAEERIAILAGTPEFESSALAIQAALYAYRIALSPWRALFWGRRVMNKINEAIETGPDNPHVWIEQGNAMFYAPHSFGGSKHEAIKSYKKAISLFEADMKETHKWLYLNTLVGLAKSYNDTGNRAMALSTYRKALRFEPDFTWVRDRLLPELLSE